MAMKKILERGQQKAYEILERAEVRRKAMVDSYLKQREKGQQKAYEILERAEVRSKSVVDSFLKQREKLKKLQLYRGILSLVVLFDVRYNRPDTILKKKFGFIG